MEHTGPLLICYDGSESARAALETASNLFRGHDAVVACYWQPFAASGKRFGVEILELVQNADAINTREHELAGMLAEEGAAIARAAGLIAEARSIEIDGPIDEAILNHSDEIDASAIVLGSRSRTGLRSLILGNVANEIAQRAARPVLLVPSEELARERRPGRTPGTAA
jgi:nucleotide-binding universal stress UspA family protein